MSPATTGVTGVGSMWVKPAFKAALSARGPTAIFWASLSTLDANDLVSCCAERELEWQRTANPATGTGGYNIAALSLPLYPYTGWSSNAAGQVITANFGATTFSGLVPSGFTSGWQ